MHNYPLPQIEQINMETYIFLFLLCLLYICTLNNILVVFGEILLCKILGNFKNNP